MIEIRVLIHFVDRFDGFDGFGIWVRVCVKMIDYVGNCLAMDLSPVVRKCVQNVVNQVNQQLLHLLLTDESFRNFCLRCDYAWRPWIMMGYHRSCVNAFSLK